MNDTAATVEAGTGDSTYDKVVREVAVDLRLDQAELRSWFSRWLNAAGSPADIPAEWAAACYAVYRLTKATSAFHMAARSREQWRQRAISLGSPPHLLSDKTPATGRAASDEPAVG